MPYVGHLITAHGLKPDPAKVEAPATDKDGICRFLGFVTYLSNIIPNLSEEGAPLRQLLKSDVEYYLAVSTAASLQQTQGVVHTHTSAEVF